MAARGQSPTLIFEQRLVPAAPLARLAKLSWPPYSARMSWRAAIAPLLLFVAFGLAGCDRGGSSSPANPPVAKAADRPSLPDEFLSLMNAGKNHLDQGEATNALAVYRRAEALVANDADLRLNLANAQLLAGAAADALREADEVLKLEPNSAAAYFVKGSAWLRLSNPEEAVKALENSKRIDPGEMATYFQLGLARMGLKQWEAAILAFREGIGIDPNRLHTGPRYLLAQSLIRAGRQAEADEELQRHQIAAEQGGPAPNAGSFERCKFTQARVPFKLDQPEREGIAIRFVDATAEVFGEEAARFSGPLGVIDPNHTGWNGLFAVEAGQGFRLLWNSNGVLRAHGATYPGKPGGGYARMLVGDLQNDRFEDVIVLGSGGSQIFQFQTNGVAAEVAVAGSLSDLRARDGLLMDLDFTGKLDLVVVSEPAQDVRLFRQFGPFQFSETNRTSGLPASLRQARRVAMEDWNRDGHTDLVVSRQSGAPMLLEKQRGGPLVPREPPAWAAGDVFTMGDFDNDLRADLAVAGAEAITISFNHGGQKVIPIPGGIKPRRLLAVDYDNDGWLDLWAVGEGIRAWRNLGLSGFTEQTAALGLDRWTGGPISEIHFADFDRDCDSDAVVALAQGGLRYLRNDGGNAHGQVKVQLVGNRSNASGVGCRVEIQTGGLRLIRTVDRLPVEIGVGKHAVLDSFLVHWFNWPQGSAEVPYLCQEPLFALELTIQEGSCPYLYAWDGARFRFVTDVLGAAPLGLPVAEGRYIEPDPEELVWIGDEQSFPARHGAWQVQITEELREVLYLDEAKLAVVEHEPGTEVHATDKLLPGPPFPAGELMTLHRPQALRRAENLEGREVTTELRATDGRRVSPTKSRAPQLRGLAEPHGVVLDFGPLAAERPWVLVLNGWLRFGGGMANIAASHDPALPFPFPRFEAEDRGGHWHEIAVTVGAPAGKTKTILVDLAGRLPEGTRRLRLTAAFEIHWDRIALLEKQSSPRTRVTWIDPAAADLQFRGFSALKELPPDWPQTPDEERVGPNSPWTVIPGGWCTRYGDVLELVGRRDEGLALINAGDALTLKFPELPRTPGLARQFFLYLDGWDKDSDFHVATGTQVEPLPFHGMDAQQYGRQPRPAFPSDALHRQYNTRWVDGRALRQISRR